MARLFLPPRAAEGAPCPVHQHRHLRRFGSDRQRTRLDARHVQQFGNQVVHVVGRLVISFDATNSGSISDAAVRGVMTLNVDGAAFALGDATYYLNQSGTHSLIWQSAGLTWAAGETVQLDISVTE